MSAFLISCLAALVAAHQPLAHTRNGTIEGVYSSEYNQDFFLGVPYAQKPLDDLRFCVPQSLNTTFTGTRKADKYSKFCVGYGSDDLIYQTSEDCLYLNVVRPHLPPDCSDEKLPVGLWIHGGGYFESSSADMRFNLSFIVDNAVKIGKPFIGVSINYRLSGWGFLYGNEVAGTGNTNIGLRDQRLAMRWVQENIEAFGGAPDKVTIWGESAGASSVGFHLVAYGGRDDKLFRSAVMESGNPTPFRGLNGTQYFQPAYDNITQQVHPSEAYKSAKSLPANATCSDAIDSLACLRTVSFDELNTVINGSSYRQSWFPVIDGDFITKYPSQLLADGNFVKVPIISGANTDEGASFVPFQQVNTSAQFKELVKHGEYYGGEPGITLPDSLVTKLLNAYPEDECDNVPNANCSTVEPFMTSQWRRAATYQGDAVFIANRRLTCETWASNDVSAYCYRFNTVPAHQSYPMHFQEVAFVFNNTLGTGYEPVTGRPFDGVPQRYYDLVHVMSSSWASFFVDQDPNSWRRSYDGKAAAWPKYGLGKDAKNIVFDANATTYAEMDDFRSEGIKLINEASVAYQR